MPLVLTGIDLNDPTPGLKRELAPNRGRAGGATQARKVFIYGNKISSVGSASVDGLGWAVNEPIRIDGGEDEVITRYGYRSELLLAFRTFTQHNPNSQVWMAFVAPGTGSATVDFTFATTATASGAVRIQAFGEILEVAIASGDTASTIATAVGAEINKQLYWLVSASVVGAVVTVTATVAGNRYDHYLTQMRMTFNKSLATTVTKGSVTGGSTDDDNTGLITALSAWDFYYHVCPKSTVSSTSSTDNGIGEHLAHIADAVAPTKGKAAVLITGQVGTAAQGTTVATSMNSPWAFHVCSKNNDWSPMMLAAAFAGILSYAELTNRAPNLVNYGIRDSSDRIFVPDPYTKSDRWTGTEIKTLLNNGCTPIQFTSDGKPYIVWYVTTKSLTNSVNDYRSRPGHVPSVLFHFWESFASEWLSTVQQNVADDPARGEKPLPGFTYPRDARALLAAMVDRLIDTAPAVLDPSQRAAMKESIVVERLVSGIAARIGIGAVRHMLKAHFLIEEVGPSI
jgi:phage tail sheath gpL-like